MFLRKTETVSEFSQIGTSFKVLAGQQTAKFMKSRFNLDTRHTTYLF